MRNCCLSVHRSIDLEPGIPPRQINEFRSAGAAGVIEDIDTLVTHICCLLPAYRTQLFPRCMIILNMDHEASAVCTPAVAAVLNGCGTSFRRIVAAAADSSKLIFGCFLKGTAFFLLEEFLCRFFLQGISFFFQQFIELSGIFSFF